MREGEHGCRTDGVPRVSDGQQEPARPAVTREHVSGQGNGAGAGWSLSAPVGLLPSDRSGWQHVSFTLTAAGTGSEYQISNFWVDPRQMR